MKLELAVFVTLIAISVAHNQGQWMRGSGFSGAVGGYARFGAVRGGFGVRGFGFGVRRGYGGFGPGYHNNDREYFGGDFNDNNYYRRGYFGVRGFMYDGDDDDDYYRRYMGLEGSYTGYGRRYGGYQSYGWPGMQMPMRTPMIKPMKPMKRPMKPMKRPMQPRKRPMKPRKRPMTNPVYKPKRPIFRPPVMPYYKPTLPYYRPKQSYYTPPKYPRFPRKY